MLCDMPLPYPVRVPCDMFSNNNQFARKPKAGDNQW